MERVLVVGARCRMKGGSASPSAGRSGGGVRKCERHARLVKVVTSAAVEAQLVLEASLHLVMHLSEWNQLRTREREEVWVASARSGV